MQKSDRKILEILRENSRLSWSEIGKKVYLTGQAVGQRVVKMQENGTIASFTIAEYYQQEQIITIFMNSNNFTEFENKVLNFTEVEKLYKTNGDGCYVIKAHFNNELLINFLDIIEKFARYKVNHISQIIK